MKLLEDCEVSHPYLEHTIGPGLLIWATYKKNYSLGHLQAMVEAKIILIHVSSRSRCRCGIFINNY